MADPTSRLNAALEGRYRIERELGEGGMATVYLADDLKHERKVALKVLKPELAAVVGAERFLAEIKTTANLQHPHILPLFDSGEADSFLFYVMPYVEGETLRERLDREKQLGVEEALSLAAKLCDALDYAHSEGVIHRDIKPANILLSKRGEPLVADFGIALAVAQAGGGRITETGLSLGTPHYMSPEQATGDAEVDPRSDVYALACVVYEMLAGEPPFTATTAQAILAKILTMDAPSITMVRRTVPSNVSAAVAKALEKLPADRFATVSDFSAALADPGFVYAARARGASHTQALDASAGHPAQTPLWIRDARSVAALGAVLFTSALAAWGWLAPGSSQSVGPVTRTELTGGDWRWASVSPDGYWFLAWDGDTNGPMYVRASDGTAWRALPNSEGSNGRASFSPDGQWVAFTDGGEISRVPVSGGPALPVAAGVNPHWGHGDAIVYVNGTGIYRVHAFGGDPELLFASDTVRPENPHLLPDGKAVVFNTREPDMLNSRILAYEIETGDVRELVASGTDAVYSPTGHLLYAHGSGTIMAAPFELEALRASGPTEVLLPDVALYAGGRHDFAVSGAGTLVHGVNEGDLQEGVALEWLNLDGRRTPIPTEPPTARNPRISPDGTSIAYASEGRIWIHDIEGGTDRQFTFEGNNSFPIWSVDGRFLYFISEGTDGGAWTVWRRAADGSTGAEELAAVSEAAALTSLSPDGRWLVLAVGPGNGTPGGESDLMLLDLRGEAGTPLVPYLQIEPHNSEGTVSPDGRWMAYWQGGSANDVFVRGFPEATGLWRIGGGAREAIWAPDLSALYYNSDADRNLKKVEIDLEPTFTVGPTSTLHESIFLMGGPGMPWDIHPDGDRFVVARAGTNVQRRFLVVTNWFTELRERMGEGN